MELPEAVVDVMVSLRGWLQVCPLLSRVHVTADWTQGCRLICSVKGTLCFGIGAVLPSIVTQHLGSR